MSLLIASKRLIAAMRLMAASALIAATALLVAACNDDGPDPDVEPAPNEGATTLQPADP